MKKKLAVHFFLMMGMVMSAGIYTAHAQDKWKKVMNLKGYWKFSIGDNRKWSDPKYVDNDWENIQVPSNWEDEGFNGYNGYAWYRKTFDGADLENKTVDYVLFLGNVDDVDEVYLNGHKIGFSGNFPPKYQTAHNAFRRYYLPKEYVNFKGRNLLAVRVYDSEISGGIVSGDIGLYINENDQDLAVNLRGLWDFAIEKQLYKKEDDDEFFETDKHVPPADSRWSKITVPGEWEHQGYNNFDGTAWYRKQFVIPKDLDGEDLVLVLGKIDDYDHTYFNGKWIGSTNWHDKQRIYTIPSELFEGGGTNTLLIYVKDTQGRGGIYTGPVGIMRQTDFTKYYRSRNR